MEGDVFDKPWRSYWNTLGLLLLIIAGMVAWRMLPQPDNEPDGPASKGSLASVSHASGVLAAAKGNAAARIIPTGFVRAPSGHLLPRFAIVHQAQVQVHVGPGEHYPVSWRIQVAGLPLEILAEAGQWLRIRDHEGEEGWIRAEFISQGRRTAMVAPWRQAARLALRVAPDEGAALKAWVGSGVVVNIISCDGAWCAVRAGDVRGWLPQRQLWGVYAGERITNTGG